MNTPATPKPALRIEAAHIGPIMGLNQDLSEDKQNLIYARNGTGKSFIARALRLLDQTVFSRYEQSSIPDLLVSEESNDGSGSFRLYEGSSCIGSLELNTRSKTVARAEPSYIFHVFTEDYIDEEVRNRLEELDGEIQHEIIIGRENVELDQKELELDSKTKALRQRREALASEFSDRKNKHKTDFSIVGSLGAFKSLSADVYFGPSPYSPSPEGTSLKSLHSQYDKFKSLPTDRAMPTRLSFEGPDVDLYSVHEALAKVTSPSTVRADFKAKIESDPGFFETGLALHKEHPEECPFCTQPVQGPAIAAINMYVQYFQDEEAREKDRLNKLFGQIDTGIAKTRQCSLQHLREKPVFDELRSYFPSLDDKALEDPLELLDDITGYLDDLKKCIQEKQKDLTKVVEGSTGDMNSMVSGVMSIIERNNALFEQLQTLASNSSTERRGIQNASCKRLQQEFYEENREAVLKIRELESDCRELNEDIVELKRLHGETASARDRVVSTFSALLKRFFGDKYTFDGTEFKVRRNNREMRRGSDRTLSDGEKAGLAFCYFLAQTHLRVNSVEDYEKLYFVFDDPVTSMSFDYVYTIIQSLKLLRISEDGEIQFNLRSDQHRPKMLILTHNNYFFNVSNANRVVQPRGLFQLVPGEDKHELTSQRAFATPHALHLKAVYDVANGSRRADHTTPNSIRSVIEGIWKFCRPDFSNLEEFLGYLIGEHGIEIKSVMINDLSHGGKMADPPHDEEDIKQAAVDAISVVGQFAKGQLKDL